MNVRETVNGRLARRPRHDRGGFAIIEMLLAIFLLALGVTTTAYIIPMASKGLGKSKIMTQAAFFAQQRIEEAMVSPIEPDVKVHPDEPTLTGAITRSYYSVDPALRYFRSAVYRTDDPSRRPLVVLESVGK